MIFFVGSSLQLKHAKLQGAMQMILLSVICVASSVSGFTLEMPELPDLRGRRLEIPSFSRLSQSASSFVARSSWHRGKSLWWKFHIENGGRTKGNQRCSCPRSRRLRAWQEKKAWNAFIGSFVSTSWFSVALRFWEVSSWSSDSAESSELPLKTNGSLMNIGALRNLRSGLAGLKTFAPGQHRRRRGGEHRRRRCCFDRAKVGSNPGGDKGCQALEDSETKKERGEDVWISWC